MNHSTFNNTPLTNVISSDKLKIPNDDNLFDIHRIRQEQESGTNNQGKYRIPGHLKEPIISEEMEHVIDNNFKFKCRRHRQLNNTAKKLSVNKHIYQSCKSPIFCLLNYFRNTNPITKRYIQETTRTETLFKNFIYASFYTYCHQKSVYDNETLSNDRKKELVEEFMKHMDFPNLLTAFRNKMSAEYHKDILTQNTAKFGEFLQLNDDLLVEREVFLFNCPCHKETVIGPTSLLLNALDILQTRFSTLFYWTLSDFFQKYKGHSIYKRGTLIINAIENLYEILGENIYILLKSWEPYVIGKICADKINDLGFDSLLKTTLADIHAVYPMFSVSDLANYFIPNTKNVISMNISLELCTLSRSFGHPLLRPLDAIHEIRDCAKEKLDIDPNMCEEIKNSFIKEFIKNYISKHKVWPSIQFIYKPNENIYNAYHGNRWLNSFEQNSTPIEAWTCIKFNKLFEFDQYIDTGELLSDKACAPPLSHWTQEYDNCGFAKHGQSKPYLDRAETRVMLRYLKGGENELLTILTDTNNKNHDYNNAISIVCRKERELKMKGRAYCKQTFPQRLLQTALEANIKKFVFPYLPNQSMSDTELTVRKKIHAMIKALSGENAEVHNLDLKKWNMYHRHLMVLFIAKILDDMFGFKWVYSDSHQWMQRCFVMSNSRLFPPKIDPETGLPIPGLECHINQEGGFEGMRQKLWTIPTSITIKRVAEKHDLIVYELGQADNQVVVIVWKHYQLADKDRRRAAFFKDLSESFQKIGLTLKTEETWYSSRLFEYGKARWINYSPVSMGTKRASRLISDENEGIPTINTSLSTISTATENIACNDYFCDSAFVLYCFETLNLLRRYNIVNSTIKIEVLQAIMYFPNILGGLPISNYMNHSVRGLDDKLTVWISILHNLRLTNPKVYHIVRSWIPLKRKRDKNLVSLVKDIFSLNIETMRNPDLILQDIVLDHLKQYTTNPEVSSILKLENNIVELVNNLCTMKPGVYLPFIHELLRNSNEGIILHLQHKLTNVQSIIKLVRDSSELDPGMEVIHTNLKNIILLRELVIKGGSPDIENSHNLELESYLQLNCSRVISQKLREDTWGLKLIGITHPVPWEQFKITNYDELLITNQDPKDNIYTVISDTLRTGTYHNYRYETGPYFSYEGSITHVKATSSQLKFSNPNSIQKTIKMLVYLRSWAYKMRSPELVEIINNLLEQKRMLVPSDLFEQLIKDEIVIYSGNPLHRLASIIESRGALINTMPCISTHIKTTTTHFKTTTKGGKDYNIYFQILFLYIQTVINSYASFSKDLTNCYTFCTHLKCNECTIELTDMDIKFEFEDSFKNKIILPVDHQYLIPLIKDYSLQGTNLVDEAVLTLLGLYNGIAIGSTIDNFLLSEQADARLIGHVINAESSENVNLTEIRHCNMHDLIVGFIMGSKIIKDDILLNINVANTTIKTKIYSKIALIFIELNLLDTFCLLTRVRPSFHNECVNIKSCSELISKGILNYTKNNLNLVILTALKYNPKPEIPSFTYILYIWLNNILKHTLLELLSINLTNISTEIDNLNTNKSVLSSHIDDLKESIKQIKEEKQPFDNLLSKYFDLKDQYKEGKSITKPIYPINTKDKELYETLKNSYDQLNSDLRSCFDTFQEINQQLNNKRHEHKETLIKFDLVKKSVSPYDSNNYIYNSLKYKLKLYREYAYARISLNRIQAPPYEIIQTIFRNNIDKFKETPTRIFYDWSPSAISFTLDITTYNYSNTQVEELILPITDLTYNTSKLILKVLGTTTSSPNNLAMLLFDNIITIDSNSHNVFLADGDCNNANFIAHLLNDNGRIYINTLTTSQIGNQLINLSTPPAFIGDRCTDFTSKFVGIDQLMLGCTDITSSIFTVKLQNLIQTTNKTIDNLFIDLETHNIEVYILLLRILENYFSIVTNFILIRIILNRDVIDTLLQILHSEVFKTWSMRIVKPMNMNQLNMSCLLIFYNNEYKFYPKSETDSLLNNIKVKFIRNASIRLRSQYFPFLYIKETNQYIIDNEKLICYAITYIQRLSTIFPPSLQNCLIRKDQSLTPYHCNTIHDSILDILLLTWESLNKLTPTEEVIIHMTGRMTVIKYKLEQLYIAVIINKYLSQLQAENIPKILEVLSRTNLEVNFLKINEESEFLSQVDFEFKINTDTNQESILNRNKQQIINILPILLSYNRKECLFHSDLCPAELKIQHFFSVDKTIKNSIQYPKAIFIRLKPLRKSLHKNTKFQRIYNDFAKRLITNVEFNLRKRM